MASGVERDKSSLWMRLSGVKESLYRDTLVSGVGEGDTESNSAGSQKLQEFRKDVGELSSDGILKDNGVGGLGGRVLRKSEGDQRPVETSWSGDGEFIMLSGEVAAPVSKRWILRKEEQYEKYRMSMKSRSEIETETGDG
jgi:hypothetical protein